VACFPSLLLSYVLISTSNCLILISLLLPVCSHSCLCLNPCRSLHMMLIVNAFLPAVKWFNTCHPALFHTPSYALGFRHALVLLPYTFLLLNSQVDSLSAFQSGCPREAWLFSKFTTSFCFTSSYFQIFFFRYPLPLVALGNLMHA